MVAAGGCSSVASPIGPRRQAHGPGAPARRIHDAEMVQGALGGSDRRRRYTAFTAATASVAPANVVAGLTFVHPDQHNLGAYWEQLRDESGPIVALVWSWPNAAPTL